MEMILLVLGEFLYVNVCSTEVLKQRRRKTERNRGGKLKGNLIDATWLRLRAVPHLSARNHEPCQAIAAENAA